MMHYKDRTFCPFETCANFASCPNALTGKIKHDAARWWGGDDAPVSVWFDRPGCFEVKEND